MVRLRRPSPSEIAARLDASDQPFSYAEVGATGDLLAPLPPALAASYDLDRHEFPMGEGRKRFERAREALAAWRHFEIRWLELHGASAPAREGQTVATLAYLGGLWFLNPCRVVHAELATGPGDVAAFGYGTLEGHAECGEERFVVRFDPATDAVTYEIATFSRPALLLSKLGYPLARRLQRRFAASSARALARACSGR